MELYVNGRRRYTMGGMVASEINASAGVFIVGQDLNETDGSFSENRAFVGSITQVNAWENRFDAKVYVAMSHDCHLLKGGLVSWDKFMDGFYGHVQFINNSECQMPGKFIFDIF